MSGAALFNLAQTALTSDAGNISSSSSRDGLARAASMPLQRQRNNGATKPPLEWRRFLTVEERTGVRSKIRAAYADQCKSYEELLDTVGRRPFFCLLESCKPYASRERGITLAARR